jgi:hypothetical protein
MMEEASLTSVICCSIEDNAIVDEQLKQADSVILTYALDRPQTFQNLTTFWLPRLRQLQVRIFSFSCNHCCIVYIYACFA